MYSYYLNSTITEVGNIKVSMCTLRFLVLATVKYKKKCFFFFFKCQNYYTNIVSYAEYIHHTYDCNVRYIGLQQLFFVKKRPCQVKGCHAIVLHLAVCNDDIIQGKLSLFSSLTLTRILPEPIVIRLSCHQYRARPACTSLQSDQAI